MVRATVPIVLVLMFAAVMLLAAGCATGERQRGQYSGEQHNQHVPSRPYTAA